VVDVIEDVAGLVVMGTAEHGIRSDSADDVAERLVVRRGVGRLEIEGVVREVTEQIFRFSDAVATEMTRLRAEALKLK
jgi:hypothetical protein